MYDVISASGERIGTYCNGDNLNNLVSDSTSMTIAFDSDGSSTASGFRIYYKQVSGKCISITYIMLSPHPTPRSYASGCCGYRSADYPDALFEIQICSLFGCVIRDPDLFRIYEYSYVY